MKKSENVFNQALNLKFLHLLTASVSKSEEVCFKHQIIHFLKGEWCVKVFPSTVC